MSGCVYGLINAAEPCRIRYIGWTQNPTVRLKQHRLTRSKRTKKDWWIWSMRERGAVVDMVIMQQNATLEDEVFWIAAMQPDLNGTAGGAGGATRPKGVPHGKGRYEISAEGRLNMSAAVKARWDAMTTEDRLAATAKLNTPETNAKTAAAVRLRVAGLTLDGRKARVAPMKGKRVYGPISETHREAVRRYAQQPRTEQWKETMRNAPRVCCVLCHRELQARHMSKHTGRKSCQ